MKIKNMITISGLLTFAILAAVTLLILAYWPKNVSVNDRGELVMTKVLGQPTVIPLYEIKEQEMNDSLLKNLIRTNGLSLFRYHYGHFRNMKTKQNLFLFLTGKKERKCFEYNGRIYVVDSWEQV